MQISSVPLKFQLPFGAGAASGYIRSVPLTSSDPTAASLTLGFPPDTFVPVGSGGTPPNGEDFNGILNQISAWAQWQAAGSPVRYDSAFATAIGGYPQGAVLASATTGNLWISLVDNNTSNPDMGGAGWSSLGTSSEVGVIKEYAGISPPVNHIWANGANISRLTYAILLNTITAQTTATTANGNATLTAVAVDFSQAGLVGAPIEGAGIPNGTTVTAVTSTTIAMSNPATANASSVSIRIFPWGNGDGATTFGIPDKRERVSVGRANMGGTGDPGRLTTMTISGGPGNLGTNGGAEQIGLTSAQNGPHAHGVTDPEHNHGITDPEHSHGVHANGYATTGTGAGLAASNNPSATDPAATGITINNAFTGISIQSSGFGTPHNNVQPTIVCNYVMRYQ